MLTVLKVLVFIKLCTSSVKCPLTKCLRLWLYRQTGLNFTYCIHTPYNDIGVVANVAENWLESRLTTKIGLQQVMKDKH